MPKLSKDEIFDIIHKIRNERVIVKGAILRLQKTDLLLQEIGDQLGYKTIQLEMRNININPYDIEKEDCPLITFSDHSSGFIEWIIKWRTKGHYNHVMWLIKPGVFASQGNTYSKVDAKRYMKRGNRLKYVKIKGLTPVQKKLIIASIEKKLRLPWWKKLYDWVGIFGQAIGIRKINISGLNYCSEEVVVHLIKLIKYATEPLLSFLKRLPQHGSPETVNYFFKNNPENTRVVGRWDYDAE